MAPAIHLSCAPENGRIPENTARNRRILWFAIGCAGLFTCHILALLLPARWNKEASNFVFVAESAFAIISLHAARKRAEGVARTYWLLFTLAVVVFGVANAIWAAEATLQFPGPLQHALLFFYRLYAAPLAMTLVLRRYQGGVGLTKEAGLDFLQVGIVGWLIFLALFYLPAQNLSLSDARFLSVIQIGNAINLLLLIGVVIRWRTESDLLLRGLRGRLAGFVGLYATVAAVGNWIDAIGESSATRWFDLAWAAPYLAAAVLAASWEAPAESETEAVEPRSRAGLMTENLVVAMLVLAVVVLSDRVPEPWHSLANVAVGISLAAYSVRLSLSQHRQQEELRVRQDTEGQLRGARDELSSSLQNARHRAMELNLLTQLGHFLQASMTEEEAFQLVASALKQLLPDCAGGLYRIDDAGQQATLVEAWGSTPLTEKSFNPSQCWAARRRRPHSSSQQRGSTISCSHLSVEESRLATCIPLLSDGELVGNLVILAASNQGSEAESTLAARATKARRVGTAVAEQMGLTLANLRLRAAMREQAIRDPLTGLFNRRYLEETLGREVQRACRQERALSVLMLDLDHFKRLNDTYGHDAGDLVLHAVGDFLRSRTRTEDIACRCGGEEFVVIMPESTLENAARRAQEICDGIGQLRMEYQTRSLGAITVSIGVSGLASPGEGSGLALLKAADIALYRAKREGRNRVVVFDDRSGNPVERASAAAAKA